MFKRILSVFFILYCVSLATTMAGMETFGYGFTAFVIFYWAFARQKSSVPVRRLDGSDAKIEWAFLLMIAIVIIGAFTSPHLPIKYRIDVVGQQRWIPLLYALTAWLVASPALASGDSEGHVVLPKAFWILFICYSVAVLFGIAQSLFNIGFFFRPAYDIPPDVYGHLTVWRARGFFSNTMSFSYCLGQIACYAYAFYLAANLPNKKRRWLLAIFIWLTLGIVFTFTRGAWLGAMFAFVSVAFLHRKKLGVKVAAGIVALLVALSIFSSGIRMRLKSIIHEPAGQVSVAQRFQVWHVNLRMFEDHPWFGIGYGYNYYYTPEYNLKVLGHPAFAGNAHNNFLEVLAGCGIFGFFVWLWICGYFFWRTWRLFVESPPGSFAHSLALGSLGAQIFFHFGGLTQTTFFDAKNTHVLILGWAFVLAQDFLRKYRQGAGEARFA